MTDFEYQRALAGFKSRPERHYLINDQMPTSVAALNALAKIHGYTPPAQLLADAPTQLLAPPAPVALKQEQQGPVAKAIDTVVNGVRGGGKAAKTPAAVTGDAPPSGEAVEIPENLGALKFNELKSLAAKLGISPMPNTQNDLLTAIEAKRAGAAS